MNLHLFDVKSIKNVELRRETFKTTQKYKSDLITMNCIDFISNRSKQLKLQKRSIYNELHRFDVETVKTTRNIKRDQITMNLHRFIQNNAKQQKRSNYDELHRFDVITIKNVELRRNAFKTTQKYKSDLITMNCIDFISNRSKQLKLQKRSNYNELHRFDVITIKNVELRRNAFKTTQNYKSNQITMTCIDLMSKHSKLQK